MADLTLDYRAFRAGVNRLLVALANRQDDTGSKAESTAKPRSLHGFATT